MGAERPADALDRHALPSLPELAVRLVQAQQGVRYARREMLLRARWHGNQAQDMIMDDPKGAYAAAGMRAAYRTAAKMLKPFSKRY